MLGRGAAIGRLRNDGLPQKRAIWIRPDLDRKPSRGVKHAASRQGSRQGGLPVDGPTIEPRIPGGGALRTDDKEEAFELQNAKQR